MSQAIPAVSPHDGGLRSDRLSFWEVAAQSVATIAPSAIPAMIVPLVFATAGNGTWVAFAFGTLAVILVALNVNVFARRLASPGSIFHFVTLGLGATWGAIAGWSLLIAYFFSGAAVLSGSVHYLEVFFEEVFAWHFTLVASLSLTALLVAVIPVVVAVFSVGLLSVPVIGSLYPVPSWPLNLFPYIFLALILSGVARLLFLKWKEPATFAAIDRDSVIAKGLIHETTREALSELSEPLFQPK